MKWKSNILNLKAYQPGRTIDQVKKDFGLEKITKLASNENPFGYSPKVTEALANTSVNFALYPDGSATKLKEALEKHTSFPKEQIILGNGSDELIQLISRCLLHPGANTIMATPTFSQYKHNAIVEGAEVREIPLVDGYHDLPAMLKAIDERTSVIWLCTPNNPSSVTISENELLAFLDEVPEDILVVIDQAYCEYVVAEDYHDAATIINKYPNVIALYTFSKIYGLASFRVGYGIANKEVIAKLEPVREPFNVNTLAQIIAIAALEDQSFIEECKKKNREGLQQYYDFCEAEGLFYYPSQGNFILIDFQRDSDEVFQYFMSKGYIVRSGRALGYPGFIRVTVGSKEQNDGMMDVFRALLSTTIGQHVNI